MTVFNSAHSQGAHRRITILIKTPAAKSSVEVPYGECRIGDRSTVFCAGIANGPQRDAGRFVAVDGVGLRNLTKLFVVPLNKLAAFSRQLFRG